MPKNFDIDMDKKIDISSNEFAEAVVGAMRTEPFESMANEIEGIEGIFFAFSARVAGILFKGRI